MPITRNKRTRPAALVLSLLLALVAAGCASQFPQLYPPNASTSQGAEVRTLYDIVFVLAVVIFLAVEGAIIYAVVRYRRKPDDVDLPPQTHGNNLVEIIWTIIPTIIVVYLFVISWQALNTVEAKSDHPGVRVRAIAERFAWSFAYLGDDGTTPLFATDAQGHGVFGTMVVPVGEPIHVTLKSLDVIHAFYVPKFLFKRDVNPGPRENNFDFTVDAGDAGQTFRGQCAELCGAGHGGMTFEVKAVTRAEYDTWLKQQIDAAKKAPPASGSPPAGSPPGGSPGGSPPAGSPPGGSPPTAGPVIELAAQNIAFDKTTLQAPADKPFQIHFTNKDNATQHNVQIKNPDGTVAFSGDLVTGPAEATYNVPALKAGSYPFSCVVHPAMTGTMTVQ
jgi:cytochrome c oxidase subunit 2